MNKLTLVMLMAAAGFVALNCSAWTVTVDQTVTNLNPVMLAPQMDDAPDSWAQRPNRDLVANTNKAVVMGEIYRTGRQLIVAANSGNITNGTVSTVTTVTNIVGSVTNVVVSTNVALVAVSVPVSGLSAADGTVYWYRARPTADTKLRLSVDVSSGGTAIIKNGRGDLIKYTADGVYDFDGLTGPLYIYTDGTGQTNTVNAASW